MKMKINAKYKEELRQIRREAEAKRDVILEEQANEYIYIANQIFLLCEAKQKSFTAKQLIKELNLDVNKFSLAQFLVAINNPYFRSSFKEAFGGKSQFPYVLKIEERGTKSVYIEEYGMTVSLKVPNKYRLRLAPTEKPTKHAK